MRLSPAIATGDRMRNEMIRLYSTASFLMGTERYRDTGGNWGQGEVTNRFHAGPGLFSFSNKKRRIKYSRQQAVQMLINASTQFFL